ncbi:uncharacterized protein LOC121089777 isoform X2 [Falco naumanni]|uniref:uncharacterized protein LOC121089777 isoform X2 n=1 Tax=Falco naumanni TaxID=148594 RepID=UPI001ADE307A|nr:uncharacterized protein LOC121089777 isoform X2 [Falco naumanni]
MGCGPAAVAGKKKTLHQGVGNLKFPVLLFAKESSAAAPGGSCTGSSLPDVASAFISLSTWAAVGAQTLHWKDFCRPVHQKAKQVTKEWQQQKTPTTTQRPPGKTAAHADRTLAYVSKFQEISRIHLYVTLRLQSRTARINSSLETAKA